MNATSNAPTNTYLVWHLLDQREGDATTCPLKYFWGNFLFIYNVVKILLDGGAIPSKLTNFLIVLCLFSPVAIHTFAEEELRLETSSKE